MTGGEPLLYSRWADIIQACGPDASVVISTNGRHFSNKNLDVIADLPQIKEFRTSLDGLTTNDVIRDGSDFKNILKTLERLRKILPDKQVMIQTVLYRQNLFEVPLLYEKLKELNIYKWRLSQLWKTVRTEKNKEIIDFSDYNQMFSLFTALIQNYLHDEKPFMLSIDNVYYSWSDQEAYSQMAIDGHPCEYNFDYLCINANGDLVFCPALNVPYASVSNSSIEDAVNKSNWLKEFKNMTVGELGCGDCRYLSICGGGCRADAMRWLNNFTILDPNSCCMMPRIEKNIFPLLKNEERSVFDGMINNNGDYPQVSGANIIEAVINFQGKEKSHGSEE